MEKLMGILPYINNYRAKNASFEFVDTDKSDKENNFNMVGTQLSISELYETKT